MLTISMRPAICFMAATVAGSTAKFSWDANLAARIIRSGSSPKLISGDEGGRSSRSVRSARPPCGSTKRQPAGLGSLTSRAIAFTVKSRRIRSSCTVWPKTTSGLRESLR